MALVLAREEGESIVLELPGVDQQMIVVRVKRIDRRRVSLAIDAPQSVNIRRGELESFSCLSRAPSVLAFRRASHHGDSPVAR